MSEYGMALGLLFQITDDILDVVGDRGRLGKPTGADAAAGKQTYPAVIGLAGARAEARRLADQAQATAGRLPAQRPFWASMVELIVSRQE
ncbi:MAG: polyprenyl synthetase family protein, partial [Armatimonadota bacterium]